MKHVVRLVLVLRPAHCLTAPSTDPWTRMYEVPVHPNRESKLPNPDSHQMHAAYSPHPTSHIVHTTRLTSHDTRWTLPLPKLRLCTTRTSHTSTAPCTTAHENGTDQPIAGILGFVSSSHTREVTHPPKPLETYSDASRHVFQSITGLLLPRNLLCYGTGPACVPICVIHSVRPWKRTPKSERKPRL
jgi:hypothetical protein